jgi:hypothetical protein
MSQRLAALRPSSVTVRLALLLLLLGAAGAAMAEDTTEDSAARHSHYLRVGPQAGWVLETNEFLAGDNLAGEPIDRFQSLRLEFGWQTDGSRDWQHAYNFPSYGLGIYGANLNNELELGTPTSLYGFFVWPLSRSGRWTFNFELAFGLTNDWKPYDPISNPKNVAIGLGRSVHIDVGANAEYRLADRWSLIGGFTGTHFSNGGTQNPNKGLNQIGPILFAKYDTDLPVTPPARRREYEYDRGWDLTYVASVGKRNLNLNISNFVNPETGEEFLNKSYFIGNVTVGVGRRFSYKARYVFGLDFCYDETVGDLLRLDAYNTNSTADPSTWDNFELAGFGGVEIIANRTHLLVHFGYKVVSTETTSRLPKFYQRLGIKQFVYRNWFAGLNVRFHQLGSADNLEWNAGWTVGL